MPDDHTPQPRSPAETRRLIRNWIWQTSLALVLIALLLCLLAGKWTWTWGWIQIALLAAFLAAHPLLLVPINPDLLAERQRGILAEGTKRWDQIITLFAGGMLYPLFIVAGLDERFGWSAPFPLGLHLAGTIACALGQGLFLWALVSNAFFAEGVRIQTERGHTVATRGPYRWIRHPGYAGNVLAGLAMPLLLGSWWALIPGTMMGLGFLVRTGLEDATLRRELDGYPEYARRVRYRILPGVW
jgi:protein-S-isoprenylcysteine O-methyltransferase Ste14